MIITKFNDYDTIRYDIEWFWKKGNRCSSIIYIINMLHRSIENRDHLILVSRASSSLKSYKPLCILLIHVYKIIAFLNFTIGTDAITISRNISFLWNINYIMSGFFYTAFINSYKGRNETLTREKSHPGRTSIP